MTERMYRQAVTLAASVEQATQAWNAGDLGFDGDRAVERWSIADSLGLLMQLGAFPPPGGP